VAFDKDALHSRCPTIPFVVEACGFKGENLHRSFRIMSYVSPAKNICPENMLGKAGRRKNGGEEQVKMLTGCFCKILQFCNKHAKGRKRRRKMVEKYVFRIERSYRFYMIKTELSSRRRRRRRRRRRPRRCHRTRIAMTR